MWERNCWALSLGNSVKEVWKTFEVAATPTSSWISEFVNIIVICFSLVFFFIFYVRLMIDVCWRHVISYLHFFISIKSEDVFTCIRHKTTTFKNLSLIFRLCCLFPLICNNFIYLQDMISFLVISLPCRTCVCVCVMMSSISSF